VVYRKVKRQGGHAVVYRKVKRHGGRAVVYRKVKLPRYMSSRHRGGGARGRDVAVSLALERGGW
jgi:hypothetical protein